MESMHAPTMLCLPAVSLLQVLQARDGSTPIPDCLQHLQLSPWAPAALELPLLFPSPSPLVSPSLPTSAAVIGHRDLCASSNYSSSVATTAPQEGAAYAGHSILNTPTLLIDLELLVDTQQWSPQLCPAHVQLQPGCHHLASLLSMHRLAVFSSWPSVPTKVAADAVNRVLSNVVEVWLICTRFLVHFSYADLLVAVSNARG
jgi:hypothetical protein